MSLKLAKFQKMVQGKKIALDTSTAKQSSGRGNPATNVFKSGQYSRTDVKAKGQFWEVKFNEGHTVTRVRVQSYKMGSSFGRNRLGKVNVFIGDKLCG